MYQPDNLRPTLASTGALSCGRTFTFFCHFFFSFSPAWYEGVDWAVGKSLNDRSSIVRQPFVISMVFRALQYAELPPLIRPICPQDRRDRLPASAPVTARDDASRGAMMRAMPVPKEDGEEITHAGFSLRN